MGRAGIFNGKPRRLAVSAWDGLRGLWAESETKAKGGECPECAQSVPMPTKRRK